MNEKGFIQIPLLVAIIIATISVASAGTGAVLYSQGKLALLVANISEVFQGDVGQDQEKNQQEIKQEIEEAEPTARLLEEETEGLTQRAETTQNEAEAEAEKLKQELEEAQEPTQESAGSDTQATSEVAALSITNVSPNQILNNIINYLTITGTNLKQGAEVIIGGINFGTQDVIDNKTITITIFHGVLNPNTYSVQVVNPDGETAILNNSLIIISPFSQTVATTTDQDTLNAEIKSAAIDSLNKEYGLKINILQAKLIDAESIPLRNEDQARTILRFCIEGQYPDFATTANIKDVLAAICASIEENGFNPTAIGIGKTTGLLRDQILILNAEISQLQNELERKLLELDPDSLNKEYGLKINTLKARLIELKSFFDESGIKIGKIRAFYYNREEYPDFIDTNYKRQVLDESFKKADALNPMVRNDNLLTFVSEQISALNYQISQTYNELQRKLLESQ